MKIKASYRAIFSMILGIIVLCLWIITPFVGIAIKADAGAYSTRRTSVHDPSIVTAEGQYYIFGSHMAWSKSSDLCNWNSFKNNINDEYASIFSVGASWAAHGSENYNVAGNLWAPDVIYNSTMGKWCMYMSVNGNGYYSSIALATADNIEGPYSYQGTVVYSGFVNSEQAAQTDLAKVTGSNSVPERYLSNGHWNSGYAPNAIDPCVLYDENGNLWMSYGSWFGGIYMLKLDNSTGLRDYSYTYSTLADISDKYLGIKISGGYGCAGEGSYIVYDSEADYYYLYLSYGGLNATNNFSNYHMRLFRSRNITGPYTDAAGNSAICTKRGDDQRTKGVKLMGNYYFSSLANVPEGEISAKGYMSPGHNSAFIDSDGQRYVVYHTRFNNRNEWHQVRVHQQFLNEEGWPVTAVYENLGSVISSDYTESDIIGSYEVVNHGDSASAQYSGILDTQCIVLNSDGTITGDFTGTWQRTSGTYYCTMTIDGVIYKGVFFKQYDESAAHTETMTFSLIGNNDRALWGSKWSGESILLKGESADGLDGEYYIKSTYSGLYLDVTDGSLKDGTNVQQYEYSGNASQQFKLVSDGKGYYSILTAVSDYKSCIDIEGGNANEGTNVIQWTYHGGDMQKFEIVEVSSGIYAIKTKATGGRSCLDVYELSTESGGNIVQWNYGGGDNQHWYLEPAGADGSHNITDLEGDFSIGEKEVLVDIVGGNLIIRPGKECIAGIYSADGILIKAMVVTDTITVLYDDKMDYIKLFFWDKFKGMHHFVVHLS